jgi:hypothetical protein
LQDEAELDRRDAAATIAAAVRAAGGKVKTDNSEEMTAA